MKRILFLALMSVIGLVAAEVDGTWKGSTEGPNGKIERTFVFKAEGTKLTGETTSSMMGKSTIEDGKIDGDNLSFHITVKFQDNEMKLNYKGKVSGDEIHMTAEMAGGGGQSLEWVVKKEK